MKKLILLVCAGMLLIWFVSLASKNRGASPAVAFEKLLNEDAGRVTRLEGFVFVGDGYDVHLRFRADSDFVTALTYKGFRKTNCLDTRDTIRFSVMRVASLPPWAPEFLSDVVCFRRRGANTWSPDGRDEVLAEASGGWVYLSGQGHEHDRAMPDAPVAAP
jgi:hypothetical protein